MLDIIPNERISNIYKWCVYVKKIRYLCDEEENIENSETIF